MCENYKGENILIKASNKSNKMFHPVHDDKDVGAAKRRRLNLKLEIRSNAENQAVTFMGLLAFYTKNCLLIDLKKNRFRNSKRIQSIQNS